MGNISIKIDGINSPKSFKVFYKPLVLPAPTPSVSPIVSPSTTPTVSISTTPAVSGTPSVTPSETPSVTPSVTTTPSITPTPTPSCERPGGLTTYFFWYSYSGMTGSTNFTDTVDRACFALANFGSGFAGQQHQGSSLSVGQTFYLGISGSCQLIGSTGYFLIGNGPFATPIVVHLISGVINDLPTCP